MNERNYPLIISMVALVGVVVTVLVAGRAESPRGRPGPAATVAAEQRTTLATVDEPGVTTSSITQRASTTRSSRTTASTRVTVTADPWGPEEMLSARSIRASAERRSVNLRCTGERVSYAAEMIIDGDLNTGWGAGADDGTGQSLTLDFGEDVRIREISLTPGFAKIGPRSDRNCQDAEAFPLNRFVAEVEYRFDDGTVVWQEFDFDPSPQTIEVDVVTRSLVLTIVRTQLPAGADDDTILSELVVIGQQR